MRTLLKTLVPLAAAGALLAPFASPAQAAPPTGSELVLFWARYSGGPQHIASLDCDEVPPTGMHPDPVGACAALDAAGGEPGLLPDDGRACTTEYDPVGAFIVGTWEQRRVFWSASYGNPCEMARATAGVMDFQ